MKTRIFAAAAAAVVLAVVPARAEKWNLPTGYNDSNYHTQNVVWFADKLREATKGEVDITVHSGASLFKLPEIPRAVRGGQVPIGEVLLANMGNEDPLFEADMIPFLAVGLDEAKKLYDVQRPALEERFQKRGMKLLYSAPWPGNGVFSKHSIETVKDFQGAKFRAYNQVTSRLAERLGAQPVTVQVPELPQAFASGLATMMVAAASIVVDTKGWDYGKYFYDVRAFHPRSAVVVNERAFARLSPDAQKAMLAVAKEAEQRGWDLAAKAEGTLLETMRQNKMEVARPSEQLMQELRAASAPLVDDWKQRAGADGQKIAAALGR
jgi:TRAP-type C4-dicarboxylate transport system substrate-binding protein